MKNLKPNLRLMRGPLCDSFDFDSDTIKISNLPKEQSPIEYRNLQCEIY